MLQINIQLKGIEDALKRYDPQKVQRAGIRAINRGVGHAKTQSAKEITNKYNLKKKIVMDRMSTKKATQHKPAAILSVVGKRLGLTMYGARQTKKGVSISVLKGQRKLLPSAFIASWKSGQPDKWVFFRKRRSDTHQRKYAGKIRMVKRVARIPRESLMGPSVPQVFKGVIAKVKAITIEYTKERLKHELDYEFSKK